MKSNELFLNRQRLSLLIALTVLAASLYMLTYSARIESTDTLFMFDATASWVRFGDFMLDLTAGERRYWNYETPQGALPLLPVDAEPLQIWLAAPLYRLAERVPNIGHVHGVWLFNVGVSAVSVGIFFLYALRLGAQTISATTLSVLLTAGTIIWPYSKTFFQEPLTLLLMLSAGFLLESARQSRFNWRWMLPALVVLALMILARRAAVLALPALVLVTLPAFDNLLSRRSVRWATWALMLILVGLLYYNTIPQSAQEIGLFYRDVERLEQIPWYERMLRAAMNQGVQGYLFAPGSSFWGTSPIILLALPGAVMLTRRGTMRYVLVGYVLVLSYALGYAVGANFNWFGGLSWPSRFMVPTIPFVLLVAWPVMDALFTRHRRVWWLPVGLILAYSVWIQFNGVSYWWGEYAALLPAEAEGFTEWRGGLVNPSYFRWVLLPQLWGHVPFDWLWVRTDNRAYMGVFVALMGLALVMMRSALRDKHHHIVWTLPLVWLIATFIGLRLAYHDDMYLAFSGGLHAASNEIARTLSSDDVLFISELGHERYFLNYGTPAPRIISLPEHPGEQPSPDQPPQVVSSNTADLLERPTIQMIEHFSQTHERLWFLADSSPFVAWSILPVERYMAEHYHLVSSQDFTGEDGLPVRLLSYDVTSYHAPHDLTGPDIATHIQFDDAVTLAGYSLPQGMTYAAGDTLPVSFYWVADATPPRDYTVALHLAQDGGGVVASAQDAQPVTNFKPTTTWQPNVPVWDNRAIALPDTLGAGDYVLWLTLYYHDASGVLTSATVNGANTINETLAVLPTQITVEDSH